MGPATCSGLGAVSMKVECLQGAPPHLHTQTSYAGTRVLIRRRAGIALYNRLFAWSIITRRHGVRTQRFPAVGQRVQGLNLGGVTFAIKSNA